MVLTYQSLKPFSQLFQPLNQIESYLIEAAGVQGGELNFNTQMEPIV